MTLWLKYLKKKPPKSKRYKLEDYGSELLGFRKTRSHIKSLDRYLLSSAKNNFFCRRPIDRLDPCGFDCRLSLVLQVFREMGTKPKDVFDP